MNLGLIDRPSTLEELRQFCNVGWSCDVIHQTVSDHCSLYMEIYGAVDGAVVLLRTVHPEIVEAVERQVIWP